MRKLLLTVVLPLLLLLGQQGQARHELQHAVGRSGSSAAGTPETTDSGTRQPADKVCQLCLSFAHVDAALAAAPLALDLPSLGHGWWLPQGGASLGAEALSPRSRRPPPAL